MRSKLCFYLIAIGVLGLVCGCTNKAQNDNFFKETIKIADNAFSPAEVEFMMSTAEVEQAIGKNRTFAYYGLENEIVEECTFEDDMLVSIKYLITVTPEEKNDLCSTLYEQAKEYMPEPISNNLEDIKTAPEQTVIVWQDVNKAHVHLQFASIYESDDEMIILNISCPHPGLM